MMATFIISFFVLLLAVIAMAIGVILGRPAIKGSCGGLNQVGLSGSCSGACSSKEKVICASKNATQDE
jgi:hypothetical protein